MKYLKQFLNYLLNKQWILRIVMYFLSEGKKEQIYIGNIRYNLLFFGFDTSTLTDEDIKKGLIYMCKTIANCGFTLDEAAASMRQLQNLHNTTLRIN